MKLINSTFIIWNEDLRKVEFCNEKRKFKQVWFRVKLLMYKLQTIFKHTLSQQLFQELKNGYELTKIHFRSVLEVQSYRSIEQTPPLQFKFPIDAMFL
jgi:hypothetical protein